MTNTLWTAAAFFLITSGCAEQPAPDPFVEVGKDALVFEVRADGSVWRGTESMGLMGFMDAVDAHAKKHSRGPVHLRLHPDVSAERLYRLLRISPMFVDRATCAVIRTDGKPERAMDVFCPDLTVPGGTTVYSARVTYERPPLSWEDVRAELATIEKAGRADLVLNADHCTSVATLMRLAELAKRCGFTNLELKCVLRGTQRPTREPGFKLSDIVGEVVPEEEVLETEITETEEVFENVIDEWETDKVESVFKQHKKKGKGKTP